jgi:aspartate racemase
MRILGLIGGMSWESTATYYRLINEMVREKLGGLHSAKLLLWSFDFDEIARLQEAGDWQGAAEKMAAAAKALKAGGAEALLICTNTMHKLAAEAEQAAQLPVLHIADATAQAIRAAGLQKVGLMATRFTMEQDFYTDRLIGRGIEPVIPDTGERTDIHRIIYEELCQGLTRPESKARYLAIMQSLAERGAQGIILGCTEIGLLVGQADTALPVFDTTRLHAAAAAEWLTAPQELLNRTAL